jgi:N-acetylglutamate synthase-like GNAT family acetyltransferase
MQVRTATIDDLPAVLNVLDGAALQTDIETVKRAVEDDDVLVAVPDEGGAVLGALVLDGTEIVAVAVRLRRRGQGIGTALVETAMLRRDSLVAEFDERVAPFWRAVGFEIVADERGRLRGRRRS